MKVGDVVEIKATGRIKEFAGEGAVAVVETTLELLDTEHVVTVYVKVTPDPEPTSDTLEETDAPH